MFSGKKILGPGICFFNSAKNYFGMKKNNNNKNVNKIKKSVLYQPNFEVSGST